MPQSDQELIAQVRAGRSDGFRELMERHGPALFSFLVHRLGDRAAAEDLYEDAFMKVWRNIARYREQGRFRAWLFTIAHRLVLDDLEKSGRRRAQSLDESSEGSEPLSQRLAEAEPGPERSAASQLAKDRIEAALAVLPQEQRQVFLMREYGGLSFAEIADALDCPLSTALARMRYAVQKLREKLGDLDA